MIKSPETRDDAFPMADMLSIMMRVADLLDRMQGMMVPADFFDHQIWPLPAGAAGRLNLSTIRPFTYVLIPNVPRALTLVGVGEEMKDRFTGVLAGKTLNLMVPQMDVLSIDYGAGAGTVDYLDVYFSVRPIALSIY